MQLSSPHLSSPGKRPSDLKTGEVVLINKGKLLKRLRKIGQNAEVCLGRDGKVCSCLLMMFQDYSEKTCTVALSCLILLVIS